jgi:ankyrin repeat protein
VFTELHKAAGSGDTRLVLDLLDKGAAIDAVTSEGYTPLMCALMRYVITNTKNETALALIEQGANVNSKTKSGFTPLMAAVSLPRGSVGKQAELDVVRVLLESGADVNAVDNDGKTALNLAVYPGKTEVIELFMKHGAKSP